VDPYSKKIDEDTEWDFLFNTRNSDFGVYAKNLIEYKALVKKNK
jgi:hypothetical protein